MTHAEMVSQPAAFWVDRAVASSAGGVEATFVAESDGAWVGMVAGHRRVRDDPRIELVAMWVAPSMRGTNAGQALVGAVTNWATKLGASSVGLWVMRGNERAAGLYGRCGFAKVVDFETSADNRCAGEIRMIQNLC